ncbi:MAG: sugar transferase [Patescibacteria group bacterium]|nr:sugar transferase [Patescibacteria group bacterium]
MANKLKIFFLLLGDIIVLYISLFATLIIRYGNGYYEELLDRHLLPFTIVFIPWILIFYIAGLYDLRRLRNNIDFVKMLAVSIFVSAFVAVSLFYLIPAFGIAPKTNLFIFFVVFAVLELLWRRFFNAVASGGEAPNRVFLVGNGAAAEIEAAINANRQLGYSIEVRMDEAAAHRDPAAFERAVADGGVNLVVVPNHLKRDERLGAALYKLFGRGILVTDLAGFYEAIMRKVPLVDLEEAWFLENIEATARFYDPLKRAAEFLFALVVGIVLLPVELLIALLVKVTSRGPVLIRQERAGRLGKVFKLYKFRSMVALSPSGMAEVNGAQWAAKDDKRVTPLGKFLRASHLDELPQLINIIRGDISFVGPRPERPEIVAKLKEQIPYYEVRLLVAPGVTGWAQINHRADLGLDDVREKLQYDIYYLKNRSVFLDWAIILRTLKSLFVNPK